MTHTPGPWECHQLILGVANSVHVCVPDPTNPRGCRPVAEAEILGWARPEAEANARLIAAAPELLAALKACVQVMVEHNAQHVEWDEAVAAIAKAEGRG